jgi:hypothetical protein
MNYYYRKAVIKAVKYLCEKNLYFPSGPYSPP